MTQFVRVTPNGDSNTWPLTERAMQAPTIAKHLFSRFTADTRPTGRSPSRHGFIGTWLAGLLLMTQTVALWAAPNDAGADVSTADIPDAYIRAFRDVVYDQRPPRPVPGPSARLPAMP